MGDGMDTCVRWSPAELLWRAEDLAETALRSPHITGVALTGSLARMEPLIHDIDLVVLHDGTLPIGGIGDPLTDMTYDEGLDLVYRDVFPTSIEERLKEQRGPVPINYICVPDRALWDCKTLQSLKKYERFPDFYLRVFTDIPLYILCPAECLLQISILQLIGQHENKPIMVARLKHSCENPDCIPQQTWEQCKDEIRARKNHHWHD